MVSKYSVGFLIPKDASRYLSDDGWEFESNSRLPTRIESLLEVEYSLRESSPDCSVYDGPSLKIDVLKDENGKIENIYFRFYNNIVPELPRVLKESDCLEDLEFFVP